MIKNLNYKEPEDEILSDDSDSVGGGGVGSSNEEV